MVGRAAIGAPWIFRDMKRFVDNLEPMPLGIGEKFALIRRQIRESIERIDDYRGILHIRRHLAASPLFKGISHFRDTRIEMLRASNPDELFSVLDRVERIVNENKNDI